MWRLLLGGATLAEGEHRSATAVIAQLYTTHSYPHLSECRCVLLTMHDHDQHDWNPSLFCWAFARYAVIDDNAFCHERLAIVDPMSGSQPLISPDGNLTLCVNGEIYNHNELRKEYQVRAYLRVRVSACSRVCVHMCVCVRACVSVL